MSTSVKDVMCCVIRWSCAQRNRESLPTEKKNRNTERGRDENPCVSRETVESSSEEQTLWGPSGFPT